MTNTPHRDRCPNFALLGGPPALIVEARRMSTPVLDRPLVSTDWDI